MGKTTEVIIINEKDNVATALKELNRGAEVSVEFQGRVQKITLLSDIPMSHKLALKDIEKGGLVIKCVGSPIAPVIKITGNRDTYLRMKDNMDIDVSRILEGKEKVSSAGTRILEEVISVSSGRATKAEKLGQRDFCIFKMNMNI